MPRLMSVALTEDAVRERRKTVTRRLGWYRILAPGDRLTLCRKVRGRKLGEPIERIADVEVVDIRREPLRDITADDVAREGFPNWNVDEFIDFFREHMRCHESTIVTRIEWRYLDDREGKE